MTDDKSAVLSEVDKLLDEYVHVQKSTQLRRFYHSTAESGHEGGPYPWQVEFHQAGHDHQERAIIAANRTGKTRTAAAEVAMHLTGWYPDWWEGRRFRVPTKWIVAGISNESTRDIVQTALFGPIAEGAKAPTGFGWVPREALVSWTFRAANVRNVLDEVVVRHVTGAVSVCSLRSFEQDAEKFQGTSQHGCWLDEEPRDFEIYTECLTRTADTDGLMMFTRTPLYGASEVIQHFLKGGTGIWYINVGWDQAPHLTDATKARLLESFPEHERATRTKGAVMMGSGGVFPVPDDLIACEPFQVPSHFRRICGIDFGIDHPFAAVWIAYDADNDIIYVTDAERVKGQTPVYHAGMIKSRGAWIPVAWPHDGHIRDKGGGVELCEQYRAHGLNMCSLSARYDDEKGGGQPVEPAVQSMLERMRTGRFKVFRHLEQWFEEKRFYHRKIMNLGSVIVAEKDDLLSATRYACIMLRCAVSDAAYNSPRSYVTDDHDYDPLNAYANH